MARKISTSKNIIRGDRLAYNVSTQRRYKKALESLVASMTDETTKAIIKFFEKPLASDFFAQDASVSSQAKTITNKLIEKFQSIFDLKSRTLAERMVKSQLQSSNVALKNSLKKISKDITLNTKILSGELKETISASINENVSLIRSISKNYFTQIEGAVMRSITTGNGLKDLVPAMKKYKAITERHAKNIALDQTRKVYNNINRDRMTRVGIEEFEWVHSGGGQTPRQDHIDMSGDIYRFDKLPVIDKRTGERGIPGQAINCGCTMIPVVKFKED